MLVPQECYRTRSDITTFTLLKEDALAFSTKVHGAKLFSTLECSAVKNLSLDLLGHKTTAVAFSKTEAIMAFANSNTIYIVNTQNKLLIQTIRTFEGEIEKITFIPDSKYLITGTSHGRVIQYRYDGRSGLSRLFSFTKNSLQRGEYKESYISAFSFFDGLLAISGNDGSIVILRLNTYRNRHIFDNLKARVSALCFLDNSTVVSATIDGLITIHSLKKYEIKKSIDTSLRNINSIVIMPNPNFIMLSGASHKLLLIDIKKAKVVATSYLSFDQNVSHLDLTKDNQLLIVLQSRRIIKVKLPTAQDIKEFLLHNELDKAYEIIDKDPMLQGTREHKRVEVMYEKLYEQAVSALIDSNTKEAKKLMLMFSDVASKKDEISSIFRAFEYYPRFITLYLEKKHALAYAMAEKYPTLKRTQQYKKMEEKFKETYTFAQKQILLGREDIAKEILSVYATVLSKRALLNLVLKQNRDFITFLKAVNEKDFVTVDALVKKNEAFMQIPSFTALQHEIDNSLEKVQTLIDKGDTEEAVLVIKKYLNTPSIKDELQRLYSDSKLVKKLQQNYEADNFINCYEILDSSETIHNLNLSKMLEKHWTKIINEAEELALKGDLKGIKRVFGELIKVKTRTDKIGDLLRLSFTIKIRSLIANKSYKNAQSIIYSYIDIFGLDSEMRLLMRSFERVIGKKLAIIQNKDQVVPRDNWLNSSLIMN